MDRPVVKAPVGAVAFSIEMPDGNLGLDWLGIRKFESWQQASDLGQGYRYVFAFRREMPAEGELAELAQDRERLDWVEAAAVDFRYGAVVADLFRFCSGTPTIRQAIDKARADSGART